MKHKQYINTIDKKMDTGMMVIAHQHFQLVQDLLQTQHKVKDLERRIRMMEYHFNWLQKTQGEHGDDDLFQRD